MPASYYDVNVHPTKMEVRFKDEDKLYKIFYHAIKSAMLKSEFLDNSGETQKEEKEEQKREERTTSKGGNLIYSICKIKYKFYAEDGTNIEAITIGEGMDSGDKATNKAMAIAMKYALFQVFCIPTEEMKDPDGETPEGSVKKGENISEENIDELVTEQQAKTVYAIMRQKGLDVEKQLSINYNITNTKDLTKRQYASILNAIKVMPNVK